MSFDSKPSSKEHSKGMAPEADPQDDLVSTEDSARDQSKSPARQVVSTRAKDEKERKRQQNRQSKTRCRNRKNNLIKKLEVEIARLSAEQKLLHDENAQLRQELQQSCNSHTQQTRLSKVDQIGAAALSRITGNQNCSIPILALLQIQASLNLSSQWGSAHGAFSASSKAWK